MKSCGQITFRSREAAMVSRLGIHRVCFGLNYTNLLRELYAADVSVSLALQDRDVNSRETQVGKSGAKTRCA